MRRMRVVLLATLAVIAAAVSSMRAAQEPATTGAELFREHCARCHGDDAKTPGPSAIALGYTVPDLTAIAQRNDGVFPAERIKRMIAGPDDLFIPAHTSSRMPVWGPTFRALDPGGDTNARFKQLVEYLESIQRK